MTRVYVNCGAWGVDAACQDAEEGRYVHLVSTTLNDVACIRARQPRLRACNPAPRLHFLPDTYVHRWAEFPEAPVTVWCEDDKLWDSISRARPGAARGVRPSPQRPTFPPRPLTFDLEAGSFVWQLPHGAALRAWGAPTPSAGT